VTHDHDLLSRCARAIASAAETRATIWRFCRAAERSPGRRRSLEEAVLLREGEARRLELADAVLASPARPAPRAGVGRDRCGSLARSQRPVERDGGRRALREVACGARFTAPLSVSALSVEPCQMRSALAAIWP
jgi:hypothetical protein